jgi:acetyl esterase/lipase
MIRFMTITAILTATLTGCHLRARAKVEEKVAFHDDLNYSATADQDAGFDLYTPKTATGKTPAVVFIHGGYWRNQTRSYHKAFTGLYQNFGLALASRGIATAVIDYRLYPRAKIEDQLSDVANAVQYLKANAEKFAIDPGQIYLAGHSAGGHLALLILWQKKNADVRGVIALSPILDIAHMRQNKEADFNKELTVPFFGEGADDAKYSPATYAAGDVKAALILFGEKDYPYLVEQGKKYADKFAAAGLKQIRIDWIKNTDHSDMVMDVHTSDDKVSDVIGAYISKMRTQ